MVAGSVFIQILVAEERHHAVTHAGALVVVLRGAVVNALTRGLFVQGLKDILNLRVYARLVQRVFTDQVWLQ